MKSRVRFRLSMIMILFAVLISFTVATMDYFKLRQQEITSNEFQIESMEAIIKYSIQTVEKSYFLFGEKMAEEMEIVSRDLATRYDQNSELDRWDFDQLKNEFGFDIYMINRRNIITHSSHATDIGLDFNDCCQKLARTLDERRAAGGFFTDMLDIEQSSGKVKKYSYMATADKKYLIQLSLSLEDTPIFTEFNLLGNLERWKRKYPSINSIHILNIGGIAFGQPDTEQNKLSPQRREAFEQTLATKETTEVKENWRGEPATYRYSHYVSELDNGTTRNKVLEIVHNKKELLAILNDNKKMFLLRLTIILLITIGLSHLISKRVTELIYLAFHDNLTGLKNKTAFNETLSSTLGENQGTTALLLLDFDNFKLINDTFGHQVGDDLLKGVAARMKSLISKKESVFRWGGDEFAVILPSATPQQAEKLAASFIEKLQAYCEEQNFNLLNGAKVTVSIGIAFAPEHGVDAEMLYKHADIALANAKLKGKNQYQFYQEQK
ncbi:hypothetical protein BEP19_13020 [Ammoniphilus oxalaticus]|uniref:GGDEF domain-containing protein n=1 Tax=Ammoniphilus oxalaticus TaxID=66863 RepID=A0A419SH63_9BACL|nr:GGDEF domain-containing protein [Ammoniphilus oxalaticus]RKD23134.1 hypothetical protein BEP19_13020 [Ammoniphilus oxalaticus]